MKGDYNLYTNIIFNILINSFIIALLIILIILGIRLIKLTDRIDIFLDRLENKVNYICDVISKMDKLINNIYNIKNIITNFFKNTLYSFKKTKK